MTFNINEYSQGLPLPQYKKTDYSLELEMAVLSKKAQEQQKALDKINQMQKSALSITMLNMEGKERLDGYNRRLSEELSKDPGDLTKLENQNRIATLFQDIAGDKELMTLSKQSRELLNQKELSDREKASGKPNTINEFVFLNDEGGYYDFMQMSAAKAADPNFRTAKYTTYTDIKTPIANLSKLLHEDIYQTETQGIAGTPEEIAAGEGKLSGYLTKHLYGGVSPERVRALAEAQLGPAGMAQLEVMAKYDIIRTKQAGQVDSLFNQYDTVQKNTLNVYNLRKSELEQEIKYKEDKLKTGTTSDAEKAKLTAEIAKYKDNLNIVSANLDNLKTSMKTKDEFSRMSVRELTPYIYQLKKEEMLTDVANALSWKKDIQSLSPDAVYLQAQRLAFAASQKQLDRDAEAAAAAVNRMQTEESATLSPTNIMTNTAELASSYEKIVSLQGEFATKTGSLITANVDGTFDNNLLRENRFSETFKQLGNNYEIKMWDKFKSLNQHNKSLVYDANGNPQVAAFTSWLKDQEKNPTTDDIKALVEQQQLDKFVSDYVTSEVVNINSTLRSATSGVQTLKPYAKNADGSAMTDADFNSGKEVYLTVPTIDKLPNETDYDFKARGGNYKIVPLSKYKKDVEEGKYNRTFSERVLVTSKTGPEQRMETRVVTKFVPTDAGLYNAIQNYDKVTKDNTILKVLEGKLTQFQQFGQVVTADKNVIANVFGDIQTSLANVSPDQRVLLSPDDIKSVVLPVGSGKSGLYTLKDEAAKRLGEVFTDKILFPTESGSAKLQPGIGYKFDVRSPLSPRDVLLNEAAKRRPVVMNYKGIEFTISNDESQVRSVVFKDSQGRIYRESAGSTQGDISAKIQDVKKVIDSLVANPKILESVFSGSNQSTSSSSSTVPFVF